ncbi:uncharacterized protein IUM83_06719 [Phytophthora cinnamomi]|uniref:uncharacterized protein n=1 Tax=Phytophthora cinnamomi TaxID=4785 RepID=UPI003559F1A8|nr:hypothetical protein IUM83_06719 [Phytophthora cinnamomi]
MPRVFRPHHHPSTSHPPTTASPRPADRHESIPGPDAKDDARDHMRTTAPPRSPHHSEQEHHHPSTSRPPSFDRQPARLGGGRELLAEGGEAAALSVIPAADTPKSPRHSQNPLTAHPPTSAPPMPRPVAREFVSGGGDHARKEPKPTKRPETPAPPSPHHPHTTQPPADRFNA